MTPAPGPGGGGSGPAYFATLPRLLEQPPAVPEPAPTAKHVLVLVDESQPGALEDELARRHRLQRLGSQRLTLISARAELYRIPDRRGVPMVLTALAADPRVRIAQPDYPYRRQGEAGTAAASLQYAHAKISVAPAHELAQGRGVLVAVIDSAIDTGHPDLAGIVARSFDALSGSESTRDMHGTAVAGIIAGQGTVRGVAPMARILAVSAFSAADGRRQAASSSSTLLRAVEWSVANGAGVLNMSFIGPRDPAVALMIEAAQKRNAVIVAAAGNGGPKAPPAYPAAYPGVIAVTAVDDADRRYVHANRGAYIAVSAPGVDILAPALGGRHAFLSGTSFAAAHVSGIVALLIERDRTLAPHRIFAAVTESAADLGPSGRDDDFGFGRADALAALRAVSRPVGGQ